MSTLGKESEAVGPSAIASHRPETQFAISKVGEDGTSPVTP